MLRGWDSVTVAKPRSIASLNHSLSAPTRPRLCTSCTWLRLSHPDARRAGVLLPLRSHQKTPQRVFFRSLGVADEVRKSMAKIKEEFKP